MTQLFEGFDLDLPNPLSTEVEATADFFQSVYGFAADAKAHAQDLFFPWGECG